MVDLGLDLKVHCHINKNGDGDRFVGIKADSDNAMVYFPMGYQLPDSEEDIRQDIMLLISILSEFGDVKDQLLQMKRFEAPQSVDFPINAYMTIIRYYLDQNAYYTEREAIKKVSDKGRIDWPASLRHNVSLIEEDGTAYFNSYTVKGLTPNEKNLITQIHKYCVYVSFKQLGWLFTKHVPADPHIEKQHELFLYTLRKKLNHTHLEKDKDLFESMISMIEYLDEVKTDKQFYFGTDHFEYVWEKLIDEVFGIPNKEDYFPRTHWTLKYASKRTNAALEPDSIMIHNGRIYVLDAKYYRYGITNNPAHLPESSSINKQITYAEYIASQENIQEEYGETVPVFNAFIMPFNRNDNAFSTDDVFASIGEATADWKNGSHDYERVMGIVIDTRFMMYNYYGSHTSKIIKMAETIDRALAENAGRLPDQD